jgi:hypothetical protein
MAELMTESAFEGLADAKPATELRAGERLKVALIGKPKTGKSWCAATMPAPVLIYDFDGRSESISTLPSEIRAGISIKSLEDKSQTQPSAFQALESDLGILKHRKKQGKPIPASFVFDSGTFLKKAIENIYFAGGGATRSLKVSPTTSILRGKDWDTVNTVVGAFEYLITEYSALGNICFVFHEKPEKDKTESTPTSAVYTDQVTVDPQYLSVLLSRFNDVFRMELDYKQEYIVTCKPTKEFAASTILLVDQKEKPNITQLLKKHQEKITCLLK